MTEREKLIELIIESVNGCAMNWAETIADHLLANGVKVEMPNNSVSLVDGHIETDINVGGKKEGVGK